MAGNPTVQDVLRQFYPRYLEKYNPNARQAKTAAHILNCKPLVIKKGVFTTEEKGFRRPMSFHEPLPL